MPDDEIDRLLSEAEARLSGNDSAGALTAVPPAEGPATVAAPAAPAAPDAGGQTKPEKLSVRVPQPVQKKKVRALFLVSPPSILPVDDERISQLNDAGNIPLWDSSWHQNDFF